MTRARPVLSFALAIAIAASWALGACGSQDDRTGTAPAAGARAGATTTAGEQTSGATGGSTPGRTTGGRPSRGAVRVIATGLEVPWGLDFLPNGDALVTERDRADILRIPAGGGPPEKVMTVPGVVPGGEGGLLGLAVSPQFAHDDNVYVYFTAEGDNQLARIALATKKVTPIVTGIAKGQIHNGGALAFGPDDTLYVGVGETGVTGLSQDTSKLNGKILRVGLNGQPVAFPPFGNRVHSYGHRNVQGLAFDRRGRLWATEFGQDQADEVNLIRKGHDYGWPIVEGTGDTAGGKFTNPVVTWSPTSTSSPSGAAITGDELYVGALAGRKLWRIPLDGARAGTPEALFTNEYGRIRGVAAAPDGSIWFTTSNRDGRGDPARGDDRILQLGI